MLVHKFERIYGRHAPVGGTGGEQFNHRETKPADLSLERGADGFLRKADILRVMQ